MNTLILILIALFIAGVFAGFSPAFPAVAFGVFVVSGLMAALS